MTTLLHPPLDAQSHLRPDGWLDAGDAELTGRDAQVRDELIAAVQILHRRGALQNPASANASAVLPDSPGHVLLSAKGLPADIGPSGWGVVTREGAFAGGRLGPGVQAVVRMHTLAYERPGVAAVIHTHSHIDHFGGIDGVLGPDDDVPIVAPEGFLEHAVSENVYAGTAMLRRGVYVIAFSYPVVPQGKARIRVQLSAAHSEDDVRACVRAFEEARAEVAG